MINFVEKKKMIVSDIFNSCKAYPTIDDVSLLVTIN